MTVSQVLAGKRILLVEDHFLIAMMLEQQLKQAGCVVTGPVARLRPALDLATREAFDFAVLDVDLFGEKVFPVAEMLEERGIDFILTTGYGEAAVPHGRLWPVLNKPYDPDKVLALIAASLGQAAAQP